ncbi:MAG: Ig-like domain-containing protein [Acidobacteriota bacterium]|nr:Ig-like domain-containing protein [Acidobacteriota bacterium]
MRLAPARRVSPVFVPADGQTVAVVTVTVREAFDNPVPEVVVSVMSSRAADMVVSLEPTSDADGVVRARVTSQTAGQSTLTVSAGTELLISPAPVDFRATP